MGTHYWSQNKKFATSQSVNELVKSAANNRGICYGPDEPVQVGNESKEAAAFKLFLR